MCNINVITFRWASTNSATTNHRKISEKQLRRQIGVRLQKSSSVIIKQRRVLLFSLIFGLPIENRKYFISQGIHSFGFRIYFVFIDVNFNDAMVFVSEKKKKLEILTQKKSNAKIGVMCCYHIVIIMNYYIDARECNRRELSKSNHWKSCFITR